MKWKSDPAETPVWDGRQASTNIRGIEPSHLARYRWAISLIQARLPENATISDAACGVGYGSKMLAEAGNRVTGIDVSQEAIDFAKRHYRDPAVLYICGNLLEIQLPEVDAIVSFETVEHVHEDRELLKRFRAASSTLFVSVPNIDVYPLKGPVARHHWRHYEDLEFRTLLAECGYQVKSLGSLNKWEDCVMDGDVSKKFMVYMAEGT